MDKYEKKFSNNDNLNLIPEQHADYIVKRLEQFIRDGRSANEGMSFKKWQSMAKIEIISSLLEVKNSQKHDSSLNRIILHVFATVLVTIGFWGAAVTLGRADLYFAAIICCISGCLLFLISFLGRFKKIMKIKTVKKQSAQLKRVESLTKRIKKLENELQIEEKEKKKELEKMLKPKGQSFFGTLIQ